MLYVRVRTARALELGAGSHVCELQLLLEPMAALMVGRGTAKGALGVMLLGKGVCVSMVFAHRVCVPGGATIAELSRASEPRPAHGRFVFRRRGCVLPARASPV